MSTIVTCRNCATTLRVADNISSSDVCPQCLTPLDDSGGCSGRPSTESPARRSTRQQRDHLDSARAHRSVSRRRHPRGGPDANGARRRSDQRDTGDGGVLWPTGSSGRDRPDSANLALLFGRTTNLHGRSRLRCGRSVAGDDHGHLRLLFHGLSIPVGREIEQQGVPRSLTAARDMGSIPLACH